MRNTFGNLFTLTTFGESHGIAVGGVIDGFPAGIEIDMDFIQSELNRRRPGQSHITTARKEADKVEFLSGVFEGKSTGTPIGFEVRNQNQHSQDYENMRCLFRPSHADFTYHEKYGVRDHRGGGRSSARITIARCVGGALAKLALRQLGISITAYTSQVGSIALEKDYHLYDLNTIEDNPVRCPDQQKAKEMEDLIAQVKADGDTIGGIITCVIKGCPVGLGEPEFDKLHTQLGAAMLGINAVKGFEYGEGFARYPDAQHMAQASEEDIYELISSVSYPNAKAKHLAEMSRQLVDMFGGEVPEAADDLEKLAGVGRKTANVIRAVWFGHATMAVDTHVYRVSHRMGLVPKTADTPRKVEDYLMKHIPAEDIPNAHHWILLHGRYICKSTKPLCDKCFFNDYCPKLLKDSKL
jgi:chorismate synthase